MVEPATKSWGLSISDADFKKLKAGLEAEDMDDKWRVSVTDPSKDGSISVHFIRHWTDTPLYVLVGKPRNTDGAGSSNNGATVKAITWEQNKGGIRISEEQAKKEVVTIARLRLGCDFDELPEYDAADVFNYPATSTDTD